MKNPTLLIFVLPVFLLFSSSFEQAENAQNQLLFQNAIKQKKIKTSIISNGGHDRGSVHVILTNLTSSPLKITIPNGTVFIPDNPGEQDLLLIEDEMIVLQPKQKKDLNLDAFCMESYDSSPNEGGKMTFKTMRPESSLKKLCAHLNGKKLSTSDIQSAVWAVSDEEPLERISMGSPSTDNLREAVSELTGQDNSWYTVNVNRRLDENRRIETSSASISGKLKINLTAPAKVHEEVVDENGVVKFTMKTASFPKAGKWNYSFNIRVMGWKKGDYKVLVYQDGKEINTFPFSV